MALDSTDSIFKSNKTICLLRMENQLIDTDNREFRNAALLADLQASQTADLKFQIANCKKYSYR